MDTASVMAELQALGDPKTVSLFRKHGADGPMFGVKIAELKRMLKTLKGQQSLALELWETGNSDAMYLAALIADGSQMTRKQLDAWAKSAWWYMLSEYSVPWVASEHPDAFKIATKWISSRQPAIAAAGWCTYAAAVSIRPDDQLDMAECQALLTQVEESFESASGRVLYCMNGFVISVGAYVTPMFTESMRIAKQMGSLSIDMGDTSCKVPVATEALAKIKQMGRVGKKRKTAKC